MGLLSKHSTLKAIAFNGRKANELFLRRIAPRLPADAPCIELLVLPSTSAAHASLSRENKLEVWRAILDFTG
jgi:G:T/U-mismatch repair DNA glycosylase